MDFDLRHNLKEAQRGLSDAARKEVAAAVRRGINETLDDIHKNTAKRMARVFDRPKPFTLRAFRVRYASHKTLRGSVFAMDRQAQYLIWQEQGGTEAPKGRAIPVPGKHQRRDAFGGLPRSALKRGFSDRKGFFSGKPAGAGRPAGLWQRIGKGGRTSLRLVALWSDAATYGEKPLRFMDGAMKTAEAVLRPRILRQITAALTRKGGA